MRIRRKPIDWGEVIGCVITMVLMTLITLMMVDCWDRQSELEAEQDRAWYRQYQRMVPPECDIVRNAIKHKEHK